MGVINKLCKIYGAVLFRLCCCFDKQRNEKPQNKSKESKNSFRAQRRSNNFKREQDMTLTQQQHQELNECFNSVGCLHSQRQTSTVFRVGPTYVLTVFHHVNDIIQDTLDKKNFDLIQSDSVFVEFHNKPLDPNNRFFIKSISYYNEHKDFCVLELKMEDKSTLPPPFQNFAETSADSIVHVIGFGHTDHNQKTIEVFVKVLSKYCPEIKNAVKWVEKNRELRNIFKKLSMDEFHLARGYDALNEEGVCPLNCFMEHGCSGSPGFVLNESGAAVSIMIKGGMPSFYLAIKDHFSFPLEHRIEFGLSLQSIYSDISKNNSALAQKIFPNENNNRQSSEIPMDIE